MAFALYKPQICRWVTQALPALFLSDRAAKVKKKKGKQHRSRCGLQTAGTAQAIPLAPVGGRQHCGLSKQRGPAQLCHRSRGRGKGNRAPSAAVEFPEKGTFVDFSFG